MASFELSTPSPPPRVHTPQTPKHGYSDPWEPYSPRKSARLSSRRANSNRTPSPQSSTARKINASSRKHSSQFSTPSASPMKKRAPAMDSIRRASGSLTAESTAHAADFLGIGPTSQHKSASSTSASRTTSAMLPTPAKTPRKQPDEKTEAGVRAIARNLFPSSDTEPALSNSKKRKPKKYSGLTLDSFNAEDAEGPIPIFTDSRDRLPELDNSMENPFYGDSAVEPESTSRRSTRRKTIMIPGEGRVDLEEAVARDDGIVYVFRGKKIWKPCSAGNPADQLEIDGETSVLTNEELDEVEESRRITRSSIKPRLLFPTEEKDNAIVTDHNTEDEEAATDIEDHIFVDAEDAVDVEEESYQTPKKLVAPGTPAAPRYAPASPPTTGRATRVGKKPQADDTPMKKPTKARSPFDGWRRSKSAASPQGTKREAEPLPMEGASKRQRA